MMKTFVCVVIAIIFCISLVFSQKLVFSDEFDEFDLEKWTHEITLGGGGNWEFEYYTNNRSNSFVKDGILYIQPTLTEDAIGYNNVQNGYTMELWGSMPADQCTGNNWYGCSRTSGAGGNILNPVQSASIRSSNSFNFKYGRVEIRAKMPRGDWLWPALWMIPSYNSYGEWPASGEIDIVESRGNENYPDGGVNQVGSTLHWGPFYGQDLWSTTHETYTLSSGDFSDDFHIFVLEWTNTSIRTYVDSESNVVLNVNVSESFWEKGNFQNTNFDNPWAGRPDNAPFDQKFFLQFNVAVGGTGGYFPDGVGGKPWSDTSSNAVNQFYSAKNAWYPTWNGNSAMAIDYVRVYQ